MHDLSILVFILLFKFALPQHPLLKWNHSIKDDIKYIADPAIHAIWDINFSFWEEKQNKYSIRTTSENDIIKFIKIVKPYILQVPSLLYKIRKNMTKDEFLFNQNQGLKCETF